MTIECEAHETEGGHPDEVCGWCGTCLECEGGRWVDHYSAKCCAKGMATEVEELDAFLVERDARLESPEDFCDCGGRIVPSTDEDVSLAPSDSVCRACRLVYSEQPFPALSNLLKLS